MFNNKRHTPLTFVKEIKANNPEIPCRQTNYEILCQFKHTEQVYCLTRKTYKLNGGKILPS
ncbi:hypothetical protein EMQ_2473 [Acetobacter aceti NBRC 14818]|uniref:Transposase n=1 Tax=Acetobacter aceti NBRC 14818 TaxID=887700 RepID=A0AB33IG03_ACEAC|nr:hypothetical protein EMQ_2473 [Acetobacter aceti NBRC 14818]GAN56307.1 hypothetical protein Abac_006_035 [Acetobacter aceti NBRC 14818]